MQEHLRSGSITKPQEVRILKGGPLSPLPQPTFDLRAVGQAAVTARAPRDRNADAVNAGAVISYLQSHAGAQSLKDIAAELSLTTADVSRAKQAGIKAGWATDPGKGRLAAKVTP